MRRLSDSAHQRNASLSVLSTDDRVTPRASEGPGLRKTRAGRVVAEEAGAVVARGESIGEAIAGLASWHLARREGATILDVLPGWFARRELDGVRDVKGNRSIARTHIEGHAIARMPLRRIDRGHVRAWIGEVLAKPAKYKYHGTRPKTATVSRSTVKNALYLLAALFRDLELEGHVDASPCMGVRVRNVRRIDDPWAYLTWAELCRVRAALARKCGTPVGMRTMVVALLLAGAGLREGEARALRWGNVWFGADGKQKSPAWKWAPDITGNLDVREGRPNQPTKSASGRRTIPLFGIAQDALEVWLAYTHPAEIVPPDAFVFEASPGEPFVKGALLPRHLLRAAVKEAGVQKKIRVHDLRHTCAALLISGEMGGPKKGRRWSLEEVRAMLGHSTIKMTERYAHLTPALLLRAGHEASQAFRPRVLVLEPRERDAAE